MPNDANGWIIGESHIEGCAISVPELSDWTCYLLGRDSNVEFKPLAGQEPNWFHRKMQTLCFGVFWEKD